MKEVIRGYKVFNPDWTRRGFQYTCPGTFEEDVNPSVCNRGMHFCLKLADCFNYYPFNPKNKIAEVICLGQIVKNGDKCCTNKLEIVREVSWEETLKIVNTGVGCSGICNSGNGNSGNRNSGNRNSGNCNSGDCNSGNRNSGDWNSGNWNNGNCNSGNCNSGDCNSGNGNSGDWNKTNFSNGCFNTIEPKIYLFNKPSDWTYQDWLDSDACCLLRQIMMDELRYIFFFDMTEEEKKAHPEAKTTGGYLKMLNDSEKLESWWNSLTKKQKAVIKAIPNFDAAIFEEITGIKTESGDSRTME